MTCGVCNRARVFHGAHIRPGSEIGCQNGVWMDDDTYMEGWQPDVIYPPCPYSPAACKRCTGAGEAPADVTTQDDCPDCDGTGWTGGKCQYPDDRYERALTNAASSEAHAAQVESEGSREAKPLLPAQQEGETP